LAHGTGPEKWTIDYAANALATKEGWHQGARDSFVQRMTEAAKSGALVVRDPHTDLPYRPEVIRAWYDLVSVSDVDAWLEAQRVPYRLGDATPEAQKASAAPAVVARGGQVLWELRTAIDALARQRGWSEYERGEFLRRAVKAATTGALVTRNQSLDGAPIRGDRDAGIASVGCYVFTKDLNAWLKDVENVPHIMLREEAELLREEAQPLRPPQTQTAQEDAILQKLSQLGYEPKALPKPKAGLAGVKAKVRRELGSGALFQSANVFDKAWERLRASGRIGDA
jgi:hypothetical protein